MFLETINNEPRVSHIVIAENTDNAARSIRLLIEDNKADFEEFVQSSFQMTTVQNSVGAVNQSKTYYLNEPQATLLLTYLRCKFAQRMIVENRFYWFWVDLLSFFVQTSTLK